MGCLWKRGMHFIDINTNRLLLKFDKGCYIVNITNVSIIGTSEIKPDKTILSSELEVDGYDLVRLDRLSRGGSVSCYIKSLIVCSYKGSFCSTTDSFFVDIFLTKSKPILLGILYRPRNKSDFIKHISNVSTETGVLD